MKFEQHNPGLKQLQLNFWTAVVAARTVVSGQADAVDYADKAVQYFNARAEQRKFNNENNGAWQSTFAAAIQRGAEPEDAIDEADIVLKAVDGRCEPARITLPT